MERMESLPDPALCLQDLVTGVSTSSASSADIHGSVHHLHDTVSSAVSVSSAISGIMSGASLGHHVTSHDPHHHGVVPHTPSLHHEPLEKLKRGESNSKRCVGAQRDFNFSINLSSTERSGSKTTILSVLVIFW